MKNYIDPTTYDNPERAVMEFAKELDRNVIKFDAIIGGGTANKVHTAFYGKQVQVQLCL